MPLTKSSDLLLELALASAAESGAAVPPGDLSSLRLTLSRFIDGAIGYPEAATCVRALLGSTHPVDMIDRVLQTPLNPIPSAPMLPPSQPSRGRAKARPWSTYEDQRLIAGLHRLGMSDWLAISCFVGNGRTKSQCYQRWARGLDPSIDKSKWSTEEDNRLISIVAEFGDRCWSKISSEMGSRCDVQCRYRYKQLMKDGSFAERVADAKRQLQFKEDDFIGQPFTASPLQIAPLIVRPGTTMFASVGELMQAKTLNVPLSYRSVSVAPHPEAAGLARAEPELPRGADLRFWWSMPELLHRK
jgi:hypothetical protein